ncbi:dihydroorotase [Desulfovibrio sp. OttesenSCG-928-G11]|nr:dihydroorotase [Desulfovibrio sp. OttesenSCG-928-G11]
MMKTQQELPVSPCAEPETFVVVNALIPCLDAAKNHDLLISRGRIAAVVPSGETAGALGAPSDAARIDAGGQRLFPSFIDAHVHLREPGQEYKEDIESGLRAAAYGGFGAVMAMPNTRPINDEASVTRYMLQKAAKHHPNGPRLLPVGALTMGIAGYELAPFGELAEAGCVALSNDGHPVTDTEIFRRGMEYAAQWGLKVIDHCEDIFLAKGAHMNEGEISGRIGVKGQPVVAEALHVARDILLSEYLDLPVHLAHISCRQSVELIAFAKARGLKVTAETCPHYLLLDESRLENYDPMAKVNPPLRTPEDVAAIRRAIKDGSIDILVTDHAPHADHEKEQTLDEAPCGIIGLESALPLTYSLVRDGLISEQDFTRLWHTRPAEIFSIAVNNFQPGDPADFFLFDPDAQWRLDRDSIHSKSLNTPFLGSVMRGKVSAHWLGGRRIV